MGDPCEAVLGANGPVVVTLFRGQLVAASADARPATAKTNTAPSDQALFHNPVGDRSTSTKR
ncbi:MAG: hypothetical protein A2W31_07295 [Planctomycetes bacterium RBG_16_64_10]|nr:MAG: hypothetical protein A2W31_07295 [Planctomycetes bacterium RBG_16_64_10]